MKLTLARRLGVLLLALGLTAAALPTVKPEEVGLSSDRLHRINQLVQRYIDQGQITGAITMVSRRGRVAHFEAQGQMRKDAIFRIASMSKPIAGGAPVARAPGQPAPEPEIYTVPAEREITIRDLMTHTSGLESGGAGTRADIETLGRIVEIASGLTFDQFLKQRIFRSAGDDRHGFLPLAGSDTARGHVV